MPRSLFLFVPQKGAYGQERKARPSPISPAQTSAPAGDAPLGAIPCPKAPLCKGSWLPLGRLRSCSSKRPRSGLPAWWGRFPLGVPLARPKGTKTRLGRSPLRTSLGYEAVPASSLSSALVPVGSHGWPGKSMGSAPFSVRRCLSFQGLTLVCGVPAAGSPASGDCQTQSLPCAKGGGPA